MKRRLRAILGTVPDWLAEEILRVSQEIGDAEFEEWRKKQEGQESDD